MTTSTTNRQWINTALQQHIQGCKGATRFDTIGNNQHIRQELGLVLLLQVCCSCVVKHALQLHSNCVTPPRAMLATVHCRLNAYKHTFCCLLLAVCLSACSLTARNHSYQSRVPVTLAVTVGMLTLPLGELSGASQVGQVAACLKARSNLLHARLQTQALSPIQTTCAHDTAFCTLTLPANAADNKLMSGDEQSPACRCVAQCMQTS